MDSRTRVAQGGIFHVRKTDYSPETQAFLKELINESKLSILQRKQLKESIQNGEPLPLPQRKPVKVVKEKEESVKNLIPKRRKQDAILKSGVYERDPFVPNYKCPNHDKEKTRLQDLMAFGKTIKEDKNKVIARLHAKMKKKDDVDVLLDKDKLYTETLTEIKERLDFLKFMEAQGKAKEYDAIIKQELASKLKLIEELDYEFKNELRGEYKQIQEKAAMKLLGH